FLTEKEDTADRNAIFMRRINTPILQLVGVKYVLTESEIPPETADVRGAISGLGDREFRLFELRDSNTQGYSPTELMVEPDWNKALDAVEKHAGELGTIVVADRAVAGPLLSAKQSRIVVQGSTLHVTASSSGRSVLVLPFEFSNCVVIRGEAPGLQVFRADG